MTESTGFFDLVAVAGDGALLVEWADRVPGAIPENRLEIRMAYDFEEPSMRQLEIVGVGRRYAELARALRPKH